jgi:hypothetical protein
VKFLRFLQKPPTAIGTVKFTLLLIALAVVAVILYAKLVIPAVCELNNVRDEWGIGACS